MGGSDGLPVRRVLLVGFMASGKTAVGEALARLLGWRFLDFDRVVEERAGRSVPEIFRGEGEAAFRALEEAVARELLGLEEVVLAAGGGWAAAPGRLEALDEATLTVWLRVSPETAVRRARGSGSGRPLLDVPDPLGTAARLLREREPYYARARLVLDGEDGDPEALAGRIAEVVRYPAGSGGGAAGRG